MIDDADWSRIARYLAGECSAEEGEATRRWIDADPARRAEFDDAARDWRSAQQQPAAFDTDSAWQRVSARAGVHAPAPRVALRRRPALASGRGDREGSAARRGLLYAAASVLVAAVAIGTWSANRQAPAARAEAERVFTTAPGQRAIIQLIDGTHVELGFASTLRVRIPQRLPNDDPSRREVQLVGEAVFDVVHDSTRPFLVYSGNGVAEDIGTKFSVSAYPGEPGVRVVVASGAVALRSLSAPPGSGTLLGPKDLGLLDPSGRVVVTNGVDVGPYLAWTSGRIVARNRTLAEIVVDLERWYDVDIRIPDSNTAARRVTLDMPAGSLKDVLDVIGTLMKIDRTRDGRAIVLGPSRSR